MLKFYDTNALLELGTFEEPFVCSSVSLEELENIKTNRNKPDDLKYKARQVIRWMTEHDDMYNVMICGERELNLLYTYSLEPTPDNKICAGAKIHNDEIGHAIFCTGDLSCRTIAKNIFSLEVEDVKCDEESSIYKGYRIITGNTDYINETVPTLDMSINEYLIIENTDDGTTKEMRWDGEKFCSLKLPPAKVVKAKNSLQRCALDILCNPDITICAILGGYGSGKTHLTTRMALYHVNDKGNQSKINVIREPKGEGDSVGFLKGTFEDKTDPFFLPFVQQLDGGEFEMESLKQRGVLEATIPYYCKGLTFSDSIVVVDEAEDLSEKQIRLIGTRLGENSRIFLNGDYKQAVAVASKNNALVKMCNELKGNPLFATIYLGEDVRSTTSKLFSHIFEK